MNAVLPFLVVVAVMVAVALLGLRYGVDTRPGVDEPPEGLVGGLTRPRPWAQRGGR